MLKETAYRRFFDKVKKGKGPNDCWKWYGAHSHGYGNFWDGEKTERASRFSYRFHIGPIPSGMFVCHHCDNRECTNPLHLFVGDHKDNMKDAKLKGRMTGHACINNLHNAILSEVDIPVIVERIKNGETQTSVAKDYGVSIATVNNIFRGASWNRITGLPKR